MQDSGLPNLVRMHIPAMQRTSSLFMPEQRPMDFMACRPCRRTTSARWTSRKSRGGRRAHALATTRCAGCRNSAEPPCSLMSCPSQSAWVPGELGTTCRDSQILHLLQRQWEAYGRGGSWPVCPSCPALHSFIISQGIRAPGLLNGLQRSTRSSSVRESGRQDC